jgi:hypothetical protein
VIEDNVLVMKNKSTKEEKKREGTRHEHATQHTMSVTLRCIVPNGEIEERKDPSNRTDKTIIDIRTIGHVNRTSARESCFPTGVGS